MRQNLNHSLQKLSDTLDEFVNNGPNKQAMFKIDQATTLLKDALGLISNGHRAHLAGQVEKAIKELDGVYADLN